MTETREALTLLGWSDELIEAFFQEPAQAGIDELADEAGVSALIDAADVTLHIDEPNIQAGTRFRLG